MRRCSSDGLSEVEQIRLGIRLGAPPKRKFSEGAKYWVEVKAGGKRSLADDHSILRQLLPAFGEMYFGDISVRHVDEYVAARAHLSKNTIAHHLTLLISILRVAVEQGWLAKIPNIRKPRVRVFAKDFRYLRTEEERARFLEAARSEGDVVATLREGSGGPAGHGGRVRPRKIRKHRILRQEPPHPRLVPPLLRVAQPQVRVPVLPRVGDVGRACSCAS